MGGARGTESFSAWQSGSRLDGVKPALHFLPNQSVSFNERPLPGSAKLFLLLKVRLKQPVLLA